MGLGPVNCEWRPEEGHVYCGLRCHRAASRLRPVLPEANLGPPEGAARSTRELGREPRSAAPHWRQAMDSKRKVEVFSAGCALCQEVIDGSEARGEFFPSHRPQHEGRSGPRTG